MDLAEIDENGKGLQFYLIRSTKSAVHYNRPISVYHSEEWINNEGKK